MSSNILFVAISVDFAHKFIIRIKNSVEPVTRILHTLMLITHGLLFVHVKIRRRQVKQNLIKG